MPTDYYDVLGVVRGASETDIKQAYRTLARRHHPDVAQDKVAAESRFKEINEAYSVLSDPQKREAYDRFGHAGVNGNGGGAGAGFNDMGFGAETFGDIFDMFFGGARGGGAAGAQNARRGGAARGSDQRYDLMITLEEAFSGVEREVHYDNDVTCETCAGSGARADTVAAGCDRCGGTGILRSVRQTPLGQFVTQSPCNTCGGSGAVIAHPCDTCRGRGRVSRARSISVKVPAGVDDGSRIRIGGYGEPGQRGGPPGDLYVYLSIAPHDLFRREGLDLHVPLPVNFALAALGGRIAVPAIGGDSMGLELQPGTQNGTRYRMRGHGMPSVRGNGFGDLYVEVRVVVPTNLSKRERELLEELAEIGGDSVEERSFIDRMKDRFRPD